MWQADKEGQVTKGTELGEAVVDHSVVLPGNCRNPL